MTAALIRFILVVLVLSGLCARGQAQDDLMIAAAADLKFALEELLTSFAKENPAVMAKVTYGSSGTLFAQIDNGAPFDLFLSADARFPQKLIEGGKGERDTFFKYARGHLVLWVPAGSKLRPEEGMKLLLEAPVRKVAIANPDVAPYGAAAVAALKTAQVYAGVKEKLVLGENVAQTLQFVESGAADVGIIARSLALAPRLQGKGHYWEVPPGSFPQLEQAGVIRTGAPGRNAALKLRAYMTSDAGRGVLARYGFAAPDESR